MHGIDRAEVEINQPARHSLGRIGRQLAVALGFQLLAIAMLWQVSMIDPMIRFADHVAPFVPGMDAAAVADVLTTEQRSFLSYTDGSMQSYAWFSCVFRALDRGTLALWDFSTYSGTSFLGELQTAPLYPVTLLFGLASGHDDSMLIDYWVVFHFGLAAWFMFLLLRHWQLSSVSAVCGACVFAFIGAVGNRAVGQPNIFAGLAYIPLVVLLFDRGLKDHGPPHRNVSALASGLALGIMILSGHMQPYLHSAIFLGFYALFASLVLRSCSPRRGIATLAAVGIVSVAFAAPQLFPALEYLDLVRRWYGPGYVEGGAIVPYEQYGFSQVLRPSELMSLFGPMPGIADGGTLYFGRIGLGLACIALWRRTHLTLFCLGTALFCIGVSLGDSTWLGQASYHMPVLNRIREPIRILAIYNFVVAVLAALGFEALRQSVAGWGRFRSILPLILFGLFAAELASLGERLSAPADLPSHPRKYYAQGPIVKALLERQAKWQHNYRFTARPVDLIPPNIGNRYDLASARGHRATMQRAYIEFLETNWDLQGPVFDRLAVRDVVSNVPLEGFREVLHAEGMWLYERPHPLPRFRVLGLGGTEVPAEIDQIDWGQNHVTIRLRGEQSGTFIFAQPHYPGWHARVDGATRLVTETELFLSLPLEAGDRLIELWYRPTGFLLYCLASMGMFAAFLVVWGRELHHRRSLRLKGLEPRKPRH